MLGRYESPGCCPGSKQGYGPGPDCSGSERSTRKRKRFEKRTWRREATNELTRSDKD
ncbi:hypothetical protein [Actinomadura sp. HBU206391]|uniref:hypothetical protein n=1 Tax=Actinomadura sp. HBU206391 TaxID=2731692 RepID=UPI00164F89A1|nr:hypothetical protein [Actinomadura sp. HBU206391]MBC6458436.1 hypothetical protein [Actinomadura sp. HBU206391]